MARWYPIPQVRRFKGFWNPTPPQPIAETPKAAKWIFDDDLKCYLPENATTEQEIAITETIVAGGLCQINSLTNANGRTFDLAFVNYDDLVELLEPPTSILKVDAHHKPFVLRFNMQVETEDAFAESVDGLNFDFNRCNFEEVSAAFDAVDWFDLLSGNDLDHAVAVFYGTLYEILCRIVPKKRVNRKTDYKYPWWNSELRRLRNIFRKHRHSVIRPTKTKLFFAEPNFNTKQPGIVHSASI
ncbi:uncharacterized protein LOC131679392 [Topomyia yanbarensis]|uniref:uncharacterized protein LOC131679392 n=1 Tax=Topomyia yanbarensis TaxID=2498891 RepID=UPI00273B1C43|nr:uncharacterized protein LOC131679392 [Topomyia yanbarensis]